MKFTKEDAYKELVGKMTTKGEKLNLSERSINEQLDTLINIVANDEMELVDFLEKTIPLFKTADANVRNDVSHGINKYKEENPKSDTKAGGKQGKSEDKSDLEKRMELLELELANAKREKHETATRNDVRSKLKSKGVKDDEWIDTLLNEITISDDFNVDSKVESYLNLYNKMVAQVEHNVSPQGANGTKKNDIISDTIKAAASLAKSQKLID